MNTDSIKRIFVFSLGLTLASSFVYYEKMKELEFNYKILSLQTNINEATAKLQSIKTDNQKEFLALKEAIQKESDNKKSQDELLTGAVAKVAPSVVSIAVSKDVPKMEVTYQNPFGNDPFFGNFGIQIPVLTPKGTERQKVGAGTGFIIKKDGYILTNKHVANDENAEYTVFLSKGEQKTAKIIYKDENNDIAILKIDGNNYPAVRLGNYGALKLGQTVIAIGNALGEYNNSVSVGIISGLDRAIKATDGASGTIEELKGVIQTDAAINPGNSGGPLIDLNGNVVGVNVATAIGSSNISFSIPINTIKDSISKVVKI